MNKSNILGGTRGLPYIYMSEFFGSYAKSIRANQHLENHVSRYFPADKKVLNNWFSDTPRTFMASYVPLQAYDLEHQLEDSEEAILLPSNHFISEPHTANCPYKWPTWATLGLSILAASCACILYIASARISWRREAHGLRQPNQYPGLELIDALREKQTGMYSQSSWTL